MAPKKQHKGMVSHQEGASRPALAPAAERPPVRSAAPRPGKASEGRVDQNSHVTSEETDFRGRRNMSPPREAVRRTGGLKPPQSENLAPESICRGVRVTLDNNSMWNEFYRCRTEMILTKQGSRMFPYCRFRISGLHPSKKYTLIMDIQPLENSCYKWTGNSWQVAGKAESHIKSQPFAHPESPATGQHWMQSPVSFYRLKLTNNGLDQEGNTILHPMHRYLPRLHVVQTDRAAKDVKLNGPSVLTFTFSQTEFMAVTAYQNTRFTQLKVDYNPFAKGLKEDGCSSQSLKLNPNSGKELQKDEGTPTIQQHPVKKSLKSLLANHKPRSSNTAVSKPSDVQKNSTTNKDPSAAKALGEASCIGSRPTQKLISELIREAHVSLQRCNLEQLGLNHSSSLKLEQIDTKNTTLKGKGQEVPQRDDISVKEPTGKSETIIRKRNVTEETHHLNSVRCKDNAQTDCSVADASAGSSKDCQRIPNTPSEQTAKPDKRPARLPLPALALFLKQHSTKSKKTKSKPDSSPLAPPSEPLSESLNSAADLSSLPDKHTTNAIDNLKDLGGDVTILSVQASSGDFHPDKVVLNVYQPSSVSCPDAAASGPVGPRTDDQSTSFSESPGPEQTVPDGTVLPSPGQPFSTLGESTPTLSSTLATSSAPPLLSPPLDTVLPVSNSPQTPPESSTLPSDSPTLKSESFLPDPECSSFGFEPLSLASSPEPLPPLPDSIALELDAASSEAACTAEPPEDSPPSKDSSVFKWHTVLPLPEPYLDAPFTTFQPTSETLPLELVTPPLLPSETPSHPEPQSLNTTTPPPDSPPSFRESEQSLPFPAELSPLALQLPLSPTFSSLDGEGLSPTPSIADLVHFFSTDDDLGMGVEFPNTEAMAVPCLPPPAVEVQEPSPQVQPVPVNKPYKRKKYRRRKQPRINLNQKTDDTAYRSMRPNLEEVEEQLFVSFTSKEALKLHITDSSDGSQTTPEVQQAADEPEKALTFKPSEGLQDTIDAFQKNLLNDLKLMKHRQVIHPVLQEVGLKMTLLDPTLAIDLQYLGIRLPIPPPGVSLEPLTQDLQSSQGISAAFVSRTGKTTDVTQIKGWRDKFSPSEAPSTPVSSKPEAGPSLEPPKKNLSAFCSDMLDEYLENEGKLIDERAASFSQPPVEPLVYELPTKSTSYVRTLDHILKKQNTGSPASDLISGFIPPSKRPRLTKAKAGRRLERKQRGPKPNKPRMEPEAGPGFEPASAEPSQIHAGPLLDNTSKPTLKKRRKVKPKASSQTLSEDFAPLESDSELGPNKDPRKDRRPLMTRSLLRQKDLEDNVMWEGRPRTGITEERATVALTSLFTLTGFVSENPTAPIKLLRRRAPPACQNEFCRLGCICSSLSHCSRISHCGRLSCMFGCSCLKQKVVLLKNLDGSDCSPPSQQLHSKRRKRRRMKMAYILKEADSVSQPAQRVHTLWRKEREDSDPEPVHVPKGAPQSISTARTLEVRENRSSCARVRAFRRKTHKQKEAPKEVNSKPARLTSLKKRNLTLKETKTRTSCPSPGEAVETPPQSPPEDSTPKPSKRLFIVADCQWESSVDQSRVLQHLCEAMAQDQLDRPFKIQKYLVSPISQTVEGDGANHCVQYKVRISRAKPEQEKPAGPTKPAGPGRPAGPRRPAGPGRPAGPKSQRKMKAAQNKQLKELREVSREAEPLEDWQQEVMEEAEPLEDWQQEVMEEAEPLEDCQQEVTEEAEPLEDWQQEVTEEAEPLEDWQREVEDGDLEEEVGTFEQVDDEKKKSSEMKMRTATGMALPFLTGISPAGFLSANKKQPGGTDHLIQVNGKLYPLAKIQLGKMGALHPANRLAAYLTGRVGSSRQQPAPPCLSSSRRPQSSAAATSSSSTVSSNSSSSSTVSSTSSSSSTVSSTSSNSSTVSSTVSSTSSSSTLSTYKSPLIIPASSTAYQPSSSVVLPVNPSPGPPKGPQFLMIHVPAPMGQLPPQIPGASPTGQKMILQPVQTTSGAQYYRRPDGKLVQLVPLNKVKPVPPVQIGPSFPSVLPSASPQTPAITVVGQQTPPSTTVISSSSSSSSLSSFSVNTLAAPLPPGSGFLSQKGTCTFKILNSGREPIIVLGKSSESPAKVETSPSAFTLLQPQPSGALPAAVPLISLKPSLGLGAEPGVKTVKVSTKPLTPGLVVVRPKLVPPQTSSDNTHRPSAPPPPAPSTPAASEATPPPNPTPAPEPELASDLVDLDIICVDDETGLVTTEMPDVLEVTSSSETENSSDCQDSDSEEEIQPTKTDPRLARKHQEKTRRGKMRLLFEALRKQVGLSDSRTSKISTLNTAVEVIQDLQMIEMEMEKKKATLRKKRDRYLWRLVPSSDQTEANSREVIDLIDDTIEISSDEEIEVDDGDRGVSKATVEENVRLKRMRRSDVDETPGTTNSPKKLQLHQARQELQTLHSAIEELKSLKTSLKQQRDTQSSGEKPGKSEQRSGSQQPTGDTIEDGITATSPDPQPPQAPPTCGSAPPTPTPVQPLVQQVLNTVLAHSAASHNASVQRDRPRTIPNILSRRKTHPQPPQSTTTEEVRPPGEPPSIKALIPTEVLSLVQAALPGQRVLFGPLEPTVLQSTPSPGMASVTVNIPNLANQQLHLTSLPHPPADKICNSAAPLTLTNFTDFSMLHAVHPATTQQEQKEQQQQLDKQQQQQTDKQQPMDKQQTQQNRPLDPQSVSVGSDRSSDQSDLRPSSSPSLSTDRQSQVKGAGPQETNGDPDNENLALLLNEIFFLNQQNITTMTAAGVPSPGKPTSEVGEAKERDHVHRLPQPDSDSTSTVAIETEGVGLNGYAEATGVQEGPGNTKGAVLTPPPLLQMKVGGAKVAPPTSSDSAAGEASAERKEGGVAWRPMPRLVPLGLRGNPPC